MVLFPVGIHSGASNKNSSGSTIGLFVNRTFIGNEIVTESMKYPIFKVRTGSCNEILDNVSVTGGISQYAQIRVH